VSWYLHADQSRWLPRQLFDDAPDRLADALTEASRHWPVRLQVNKALSGAAPDAVARDRATSINPAVFDAGALVITASAQQYAFPGVPGHEPDPELADAGARQVGSAMDVIRALAPRAGAYVNEADYFEPDWQASFWGANYPRLPEAPRDQAEVRPGEHLPRSPRGRQRGLGPLSPRPFGERELLVVTAGTGTRPAVPGAYVPSGRRHLQAALEHCPVDAVAQAGAGVDERGLLAGRGPGAELGARAHGRQAPLHAGVPRAELGHQDRRPASLAPDRLEPGVPVV
jgi:hypothetical protein